MKTFRLAGLFVLALAAVFVIANTAIASNGATTAHFTAVYENMSTDGTVDFGHFTCSGERIVKTGPKASVKDSEICTITNAPTVVPDGTYSFGPGSWFSDYEQFFNPGNGCMNPDTSATIDVTNNGSTWTIVAYYNPAFICP